MILSIEFPIPMHCSRGKTEARNAIAYEIDLIFHICLFYIAVKDLLLRLICTVYSVGPA